MNNTQCGSLFAAFCEGVPVQVHHSGHAAVDAFGGIGHRLAAVSRQFHRLLGRKDTGGLQSGILTQREAGQVIRLDAVFLQNSSHAGRKGHHAGLGVFGLIQNAVRVFKADAVQVKIQRGGIKSGPESGICFVKVFAHAGVLTALPGVKNGKFHWCFLQSSISSSISSRTLRIRSSCPTLAPQKNRPSSTLPLTASISAWVMQ